MSKRWTPDSIAILGAMWRAGASDTVIAEKTGHPVRSVAIKRCKLGFVKRRTKRRALSAMRTGVLIAELRRRGHTVHGPDGRERFGNDRDAVAPAYLGGSMTL